MKPIVLGNRVKPNARQKKAFEIQMSNPDISTGEVMRQAGYSKQTSLSPQVLTDSRGYNILIDEYRKKLKSRNIDQDKIADKMAEFIDAKDSKLNPIYDIQIKATQMIREDLGIIQSKQGQEDKTQQNNLIIYQNMDNSELNLKLDSLMQEIQELKQA